MWRRRRRRREIRKGGGVMARPSVACSGKREPKKLSCSKQVKKKTPKMGRKRILGTMKSSLLQFGYRSTVPTGVQDPRQLIRSALEKFDRLRRALPERTPPQIFQLMKRDYTSFVPKWDHREGHPPGVEVGDFFSTTAELGLVCLHRPPQAGIDWKEVLRNGTLNIMAVSVVVSGAYEDDQDDGETLIYTGEGGNELRSSKKQSFYKDQKLERGNEALYNSKFIKNPVRVIRARTDERNPSGKFYYYDGLYKVVDSIKEKGRSGFLVFKFTLVREPGQKPLIWRPPPVGSRSNSETSVGDLHEEHQESAQSGEGGLTAFLGRPKRQKSALLKREIGDETVEIGSVVGGGEKSVDDDGHGKGHGSRRGLKRRIEEVVSGAAAKQVTSIGDGMANDNGKGIELKNEAATGAPEETLNSLNSSETDVRLIRTDDADEDEDIDEPIVIRRLKLSKDRFKAEPLITNRNVRDNIEGKQSIDYVLRGDLSAAKQEKFKDTQQGEKDDMTKETPYSKKEIPAPPNHIQGRVTTTNRIYASPKKSIKDIHGATKEQSEVNLSKTNKNGRNDYMKTRIWQEKVDQQIDDNTVESDKAEMEEDEYEVEQILSKRRRQGSEEGYEYLVLWKGYAERTWEPRKNLINCDEALSDFERLECV